MSNIKKNILAISIAIILVLFIAYGIETFYASPKYDDFCDEEVYSKQVKTKEECTALDGRWAQYGEERPVPVKLDETSQEGWCDLTYYCREEFSNKREVYNRDVFFISLILGLIAVVIGGVVLKLESVSTGIMGGGALTIIYGTVRYWGDMSDIYRFVVLGFVLAVLVWMGYKKIKK